MLREGESLDEGLAEGRAESRKGAGVHGRALARAQHVLDAAGLPGGGQVFHTFGAAYPMLAHAFGAALPACGFELVSSDDVLGNEALTPTLFVGPPDRLFALLRAGYGPQLTHAVVGGGALFPLVRRCADQHGVVLCELMSDAHFGPYAVRRDEGEPFALLPDVEARILRAGGEAELPMGMIGEVVLRDLASDDAPVRTGTLSAFEQVPHRFRAPGLTGWMGMAQGAITLAGAQLHARDIATLLDEHREVLDARLVVQRGDNPWPVLLVETEAGPWIESALEARLRALSGVQALVERVQPGQFVSSGRAFQLKAA